MARPRAAARPLATITIGAALLLAAAAFAAMQITKHAVAVVTLPAGATRTVTVPYPDALEYGNARYHARLSVLPPIRSAHGRSPDLAKVTVVRAGSVLGGSEYQARVRNGNAAGTAAVRVSVTATTVEPLPHH